MYRSVCLVPARRDPRVRELPGLGEHEVGRLRRDLAADGLDATLAPWLVAQPCATPPCGPGRWMSGAEAQAHFAAQGATVPAGYGLRRLLPE